MSHPFYNKLADQLFFSQKQSLVNKSTDVHHSFTLIFCSVGKRVVHPIHSFQPIKVKLASVVSKAIIAISAQLVKTVITSVKDLNERAKVDVCGSLKYKTRTSTNINDTRKVLEKVQSTEEKQYCLSW